MGVIIILLSLEKSQCMDIINANVFKFQTQDSQKSKEIRKRQVVQTAGTLYTVDAYT